MKEADPTEGVRLVITNEKGFHLEFWKPQVDDKIHLWQTLYDEEDVYVMSFNRHDIANMIYQLESMLE